MLLFTRICFIAAIVIGLSQLSGCSRGTEKSPPSVSSPESAAVPPPATPEKTVESSAVNPPSPPPTAPAEEKVRSNVTPPVTQSVSKPKSQTTPKPDAEDATTPAAASPAATTPTPAAATAPPVPLDLVALEKQLKSTKAIGVFSKIALKNQVDDLMKKFRDHYKGKSKTTMAELRQSYDLLMMKVLTMVQDNDKNLAAAIVSSRAAIWELLADPVKFAALDA
jgi:hypothetical protein